MANFNFGKTREALEAGVKANNSIYRGPVVTSHGLTILDADVGDTVLNSTIIAQRYGANNVFIWGQKWGNSIMKVAE